jgi:hypothetical protein
MLKYHTPMTEPDGVNHRLQSLTNISPPFVVEVVLTDGRTFYHHHTSIWNNDADDVVLRVWDLRFLSDGDLNDLIRKLNEKEDRQGLETPTDVHPKLDTANLWVKKNQIAYVIEWHDRALPLEYIKAKNRIGFDAS